LGRSTGKNLVTAFQMPKDSRDISAIAADLVRQNVDVIVTGGPEASLKAAKRATRTIPIVRRDMSQVSLVRVEISPVCSLWPRSRGRSNWRS